MSNETEIIQTLRCFAHPLGGDVEDYDPLLDQVGDRRFVLPGEATQGGLEALLYEVAPRFPLDMRREEIHTALRASWLQRAVGVIYLPKPERYSHDLNARAVQKFDAVLHFDQTRAFEPLERRGEWRRVEVPETFPSSL